MNVTGKIMLYKNDYGYSTAISKKNQNGEYERMYVSVQLPKGLELENKTSIEIINGFLSFYSTKDGLPKIKIVIIEYNRDIDEQYEKLEREAIQNEDVYEISQDDLPF